MLNLEVLGTQLGFYVPLLRRLWDIKENQNVLALKFDHCPVYLYRALWLSKVNIA